MPGPDVARPLPVGLRRGGQGAAHIGSELEFEEETRPPGMLVPGNDLLVAQAEVTAVEPDRAWAQPALCVLHGLVPLGRCPRVAHAEVVRHGQPRAGGHHDQGMEAAPARLGRIVAALGAFLVAVLGLHGRIPSGGSSARAAPATTVARRGRPTRGGRLVELGEEASQGVVADHRLHPEQLRNAGILAQALHVGEAPPVNQRHQGDALHDIVHGRGVGTGALHRAGLGQPLEDARLPGKRRPWHQTAVGVSTSLVLCKRTLPPAVGNSKTPSPAGEGAGPASCSCNHHDLIALPPAISRKTAEFGLIELPGDGTGAWFFIRMDAKWYQT